MYREVDELIINYAKFIKAYMNNNETSQTATDISIPNAMVGTYEFVYRGNTFSSLKSTFWVTSDANVNFRGMIIKGSSYVKVNRFPTLSKPMGGYNLSPLDKKQSGYYLSSENGNNFNHIIIRFDKNNAINFINSFNRLFNLNLTVK